MYIVIEDGNPRQGELFEKIKKENNLTICSCTMVNIIGHLDWELGHRINEELRQYEEEI